jgi:hypothetical protein
MFASGKLALKWLGVSLEMFAGHDFVRILRNAYQA